MDVDRLSQADQDKYMKEGRCFTCGKPGHRSNDTSFHPKKKNAHRHDIEEESKDEETEIKRIRDF
jgi:hypothetical protein